MIIELLPHILCVVPKACHRTIHNKAFNRGKKVILLDNNIFLIASVDWSIALNIFSVCWKCLSFLNVMVFSNFSGLYTLSQDLHSIKKTK
jgi:hypothetical protein